MATETFDDEFNSLNWGVWQAPFNWAPNGDLQPNTTSWLVNPNWGPTSGGNADTFSDSNGVLSLNLFPTPSSVSPSVDYAPFLGAQIETHDTFSQTYGYFEMNAELSGTAGTLSAFYLMPESGGWPPELDVEEVVGGDPTTLVTSTHSATNGTFNPWTDIANSATSFNTYAVDWEPNTITWYFNGKAVASEATPSDMHQPMYMIASLFSGTAGSWEGEPSSGATASMQINYIHAFTSDPYTGSGATETYSSGSTPATTTAATTTAATTTTTPVTTSSAAASTSSSSSSTAGTTIAASEATATISSQHATITAAAGNHLIFITGSDNTVNLSGGADTVLDEAAGGNTFNLPAAGNGSVAFNWESIAANDVFNLKTALAATNWNGSASSLGSYLHTEQSNGSTQLLVTATATSATTGTLLASWNADYSLSQILAHATT